MIYFVPFIFQMEITFFVLYKNANKNGKELEKVLVLMCTFDSSDEYLPCLKEVASNQAPQTEINFFVVVNFQFQSLPLALQSKRCQRRVNSSVLTDQKEFFELALTDAFFGRTSCLGCSFVGVASRQT